MFRNKHDFGLFYRLLQQEQQKTGQAACTATNVAFKKKQTSSTAGELI